jgi:iron complex outermembrane receptor protein
VGDSTFESEVLIAHELGYKGQLAKDFSTSISTFYNVYDKLRSVELGLPAHLANQAHGRTYGAEAELACQVARRWRLSAGYTYLRLLMDVDATSTDTSQEKQEGDSPRNQVFARSALDFPHGLSLDAGVRFVDELPDQQIPATTVCDARLGWQATKTIEASVVGQGLFDSRHPEFGTPAGRREIGRSIYGKASWRF